MPKKDSILNQAKKNASALLNSAGKDGHVVFRQNDQGIIYEILIMDIITDCIIINITVQNAQIHCR